MYTYTARQSAAFWLQVTWLIHMCSMTHSYVCRDLCIRVPWRVHLWRCSSTSSAFWLQVTRLIDMFAMTCAYVCHDVFTYAYLSWLIHMWRCPSTSAAFWLIHTCVMSDLRVPHDLFKRIPWLIHMLQLPVHMCHDLCMHMCAITDKRAMSHSYVRHDWFIRAPWLIHICADLFLCDSARRPPLHSDYGDMTSSYVWHDLFICHHDLFIRAMTHSYETLHAGLPCILTIGDTTSSYGFHDLFICCHDLLLCDTTCRHPLHSDYRAGQYAHKSGTAWMCCNHNLAHGWETGLYTYI